MGISNVELEPIHKRMVGLIELVGRNLVNNPDEVDVHLIQGEHTCIIELSTAEPDKGKVIGRQGRTAQAMRTLLNAVASHGEKKAVLEIVD